MADSTTVGVEEVLNSFAEVMSALMIDQYQQHIAELDLTLSQAQALRILRRGAVQTGQLACKLKISAPAITQLTDRLIRKGLIERSAAAGDRRCVIVALSAQGRQLVDQFRHRRREIFARSLDHLSREEQSEIITALGKVVTALEKMEANAQTESVPPEANLAGKNRKKHTSTKSEEQSGVLS